MTKKEKTILFADDDWHLVEALIAKAEGKGYRVLTATNATDAVRYCAKEPVLCAIVDIMMDPGPDFPDVAPHQGGLAAIETIRKSFPKLPVICHSVISDRSLIARLRANEILFIRKGETTLQAAWTLIEAKITGVQSFG